LQVHKEFCQRRTAGFGILRLTPTPDEFSTYIADLLNGTYDCVDRISLRGYFPMGQTSGGLLIDELRNAVRLRLGLEAHLDFHSDIAPGQAVGPGGHDGQLPVSDTTQSAVESGARYHSLDAVRAFALLLGVFFHAAESFTPEAIQYWAIGDNSTSQFLQIFRHASHSFRLELFFLIAGFFAHLVWRRRGVTGFLRNRAGRILVPLVVGWAILYPLLVFTWLTGVAKSGHWEILPIPEEFRSLAPWQLTVGFFATFQFLKKFDLTHLWFLYQLLVLYALALGLRWALVRCRSGQKIMAWMDRRFRAAIASPFKLLWFSAIALPALYFQHGWSVDTPKESLIPELPATLLFALFFGVGWALHRQPDLLRDAARHWRWHLLVGCLLVVPSRFLPPYLSQLGLPWLSVPWLRLGNFVLFSLMMWSLVFGFLGFFLEYRRTESPAWRYIADSSYWIYIVHLPLIVWLQIWVAQWPVSWTFKYPLIMLVALPLLFLSYHYLVRSSFIGRQLNGRRYPFRPLFGPSGKPTHPPGIAA